MKKFMVLVALIFSFVLGAVSIGVYYENKVESINEDIISEEVKLLSLAANLNIPCEKLLTSKGWVYEEYSDYTVFWKLYANQSMVAKLVIGEEYSSVVETFDSGCSEK